MKKDVQNIALHHGARNLRVFGSVARGEAAKGSDLDLLVEMEEMESMRAYDDAKASVDEAIPFEQAISEIEHTRELQETP